MSQTLARRALSARAGQAVSIRDDTALGGTIT